MAGADGCPDEPACIGIAVPASLSGKEDSGFFLLLVRFAIILIIGYPLGNYIGVEVTLMSSLLFEIGVYTGTALGIILSLAAILIALLSQSRGNAWESEVPKVTLENLLCMTGFSLIIMTTGRTIKRIQ